MDHEQPRAPTPFSHTPHTSKQPSPANKPSLKIKSPQDTTTSTSPTTHTTQPTSTGPTQSHASAPDSDFKKDATGTAVPTSADQRPHPAMPDHMTSSKHAADTAGPHDSTPSLASSSVCVGAHCNGVVAHKGASEWSIEERLQQWASCHPVLRCFVTRGGWHTYANLVRTHCYHAHDREGTLRQARKAHASCSALQGHGAVWTAKPNICVTCAMLPVRWHVGQLWAAQRVEV